MNKQSFKPELQSIYEIQGFVKEYLREQNNYSDKVSGIIDLIVEEIVVNIVNYGFKDKAEGMINVEVDISGGKINLRICDNGIPFNPLDMPDPDINIPLQDRKIGGLGIFFVTQKSSACTYFYEDGMNVLNITLET